MESNKILRVKNDVTEAREISNKIIKDLYKNYKKLEETPTSMDDAMNTVEDLVQITEILQRLIERRNNTWYKM
jgi:hypothetical protein